MKKLLIISFALALMAASAMATDTRVLTMGDNNTVLLDEANIWMFPSRLLEYPNLAIGEFGLENQDFNQFGIHWKFGADNPFVLGTYFSKMSAMDPGVVPFTTSLLDNRRIDLFGATNMGGNNLGLRFSYLSSGQSVEATGDQSKESFSYYNLNFGVTPTTGDWDLAADVAIGTWTQEDANGATLSEPDGFYDIALMGRYFMHSGPNFTYVPHLGFWYGKIGVKDYFTADADPATLDYTDKYSYNDIEAGFGINYTPATNVLAVADFGLAYHKIKMESSDETGTVIADLSLTDFYAPYFRIGLDADVFKWMDVRFGATSYWTKETWEDKLGNFKQKASAPMNDTYLGFGFHWNRLHIDTYTAPELFLEGFDFISGNGNTDMNFRISAVYEMM